MKLYRSFLIRCWVTRDESQAEKFVFDIEHIQQGKHHRAASPQEAIAWLTEACQTMNLNEHDAADESAEAENEE
jgi:hypothetical protein